MGIYCERHLVEAIEKYMELAQDGQVTVGQASSCHVCGNTGCDDDGIFTVFYIPK